MCSNFMDLLLLVPSIADEYSTNVVGTGQGQRHRIVVFSAIHHTVEKPGQCDPRRARKYRGVRARVAPSQAPQDRWIGGAGHVTIVP